MAIANISQDLTAARHLGCVGPASVFDASSSPSITSTGTEIFLRVCGGGDESRCTPAMQKHIRSSGDHSFQYDGKYFGIVAVKRKQRGARRG
jgi:hypothetical protein